MGLKTARGTGFRGRPEGSVVGLTEGCRQTKGWEKERLTGIGCQPAPTQAAGCGQARILAGGSLNELRQVAGELFHRVPGFAVHQGLA